VYIPNLIACMFVALFLLLFVFVAVLKDKILLSRVETVSGPEKCDLDLSLETLVLAFNLWSLIFNYVLWSTSLFVFISLSFHCVKRNLIFNCLLLC
jgi:hypothetical protein